MSSSNARNTYDNPSHWGWVPVDTDPVGAPPVAPTPLPPDLVLQLSTALEADGEYLVTHALAVILAIGAVAIVRAFSTQPVVLFAFFAIVFGPGVFCNAWFHAGATVLTRTYCPGVVTGVLVYLPVSAILVVLGLRDGLFTLRFLLAALIVAAVFHTIEVGHNVFKRW